MDSKFCGDRKTFELSHYFIQETQVCDAGESETMDMDHFGVACLSRTVVVQLFRYCFLRPLQDDQRVSQAMVVQLDQW